MSARSITNTRREASNGVRVAAATTGLVDVGDQQLVRAGRRDPREIGMRAALTAPGSTRVGRAVQQRGGQARATVRFPVPAGPWNR